MSVPVAGEHRVDAKGLAAALRAVSDRAIPELGAVAVERLGEELFMEIVRRTPKGSKRTSPHPGKMRASNVASVGSRPSFAKLADAPSYSVPGVTEYLARVRGKLGPGRTLWLTNDATTDGQAEAYAPSIEAGLRVKRGRSYGSPQAPQGVFGPSVIEVAGRAERVLAKAIAAFVSKGSA